jgi:hypothetical protein
MPTLAAAKFSAVKTTKVEAEQPAINAAFKTTFDTAKPPAISSTKHSAEFVPHRITDCSALGIPNKVSSNVFSDQEWRIQLSYRHPNVDAQLGAGRF